MSLTGTHVVTRKTPISAIIPTRNEEPNLGKCLQTLDWVGEIFVVDSSSTDKTAEIASRAGARVVRFDWNGGWPKKREWALRNLPFSYEWAMVLDGDEEATPEFAREVTEALASKSKWDGYLVRFNYYLLNGCVSHGDPLVKLMLFKHHLTHYEKVLVPEISDVDVELHEYPVVDGAIGSLKSRCIHRDRATLTHYFDRHNVYSDWESLLRTRYRNRDLAGEIVPRFWGTIVQRRRLLKRLFLGLPAKPWVFFIYSYLLRGGFLDGRAGFTYNTLKAIYWYQVSLKEREARMKQLRLSSHSEN